MKENKEETKLQSDLERVRDWAKCGIYHNHGHNESKVNDYIKILDSVISQFKSQLPIEQKSESFWQINEKDVPAFFQQLDNMNRQLNSPAQPDPKVEEWLKSVTPEMYKAVSTIRDLLRYYDGTKGKMLIAKVIEQYIVSQPLPIEGANKNNDEKI